MSVPDGLTIGGRPRETAAMHTIDGLEGLRAMAGRDLGASGWHDVTQERVSAFAQATEDFEPIHVDPEAARATGLEGTIAHGMYTLSLSVKLLYELYETRGMERWLNYGFDRVRFVAPVPVGSRIRMRGRVAAADESDAGVRLRVEETFELEDGGVVCVAEAVYLYTPQGWAATRAAA